MDTSLTLLSIKCAYTYCFVLYTTAGASNKKFLLTNPTSWIITSSPLWVTLQYDSWTSHGTVTMNHSQTKWFIRIDGMS